MPRKRYIRRRPIRKETYRCYISDRKAAAILGVSVGSVQDWLNAGLLKGTKTITYLRRPAYWILPSSLKTALLVHCRVCGRLFKSRVPRKAAFCSKKHADDWNSWWRRKGYANPDWWCQEWEWKKRREASRR